jgi:putative oxidoreductase
MLVLHSASAISITFQFAMVGLAKVFGDLAMVETFATIGAGQWFKWLLGSLWRSPAP